MAITFSAMRVTKSIFPYVTLLAKIKVQEAYIRQQSHSISILEYALKKNVVPVVKEIPTRSTFNEARIMFSKMISEAATANKTDEEVLALCKMSNKRSFGIDILSTKLEELEDQFTKKFNQTIPPPHCISPYMDIESAYEVTIVRELDEYKKMYESLITDLPDLNISNASDASVDFVMKRFSKLDEAAIRRVLDEWVAFKREVHLAMEKFEFTLYLLANKSDLIFKDDYEGLANVIRSDEETLAKNLREEAVSELLQKWKYYKFKGSSKKKLKYFKESIQQEKDQYEERNRVWWECKLLCYESYRSYDSDLCAEMDELMDKYLNKEMNELVDEFLNKDASSAIQKQITEALELLDDNASPSATPKGPVLVLEP